MIIFAPGYDAPTHANLAVVRELCERQTAQDSVLLAEDATHENLVRVLHSRTAEALFAMSHGRPDHLCAQGGSTALTSKEAAVIGARSVYAFACHTASRLGFEMSRSGSTWWGYTGAIQSPDAPSFRTLFVGIFCFIRDVFGAASTSDARSEVLEEIARRCEDAQLAVDVVALGDPEADVYSAYHCLLHLWDRLRIWTPGAAQPEAHGRASPPALFLAE